MQIKMHSASQYLFLCSKESFAMEQLVRNTKTTLIVVLWHILLLWHRPFQYQMRGSHWTLLTTHFSYKPGDKKFGKLAIGFSLLDIMWTFVCTLTKGFLIGSVNCLLIVWMNLDVVTSGIACDMSSHIKNTTSFDPWLKKRCWIDKTCISTGSATNILSLWQQLKSVKYFIIVTQIIYMCSA